MPNLGYLQLPIFTAKSGLIKKVPNMKSNTKFSMKISI